MKVGYISDDIYLKHDTGAGHPESKERLIAINKEIKTLEDSLVLLEPIKASPKIVSLVHPHQYVSHIQECCEDGLEIDNDTITSIESYEVALKAVGAGIVAVDAIVDKKIDRAFAAVRPPGHHASKQKAMGFCLFNNIAITARYAQEKGFEKVFIIDFDVHHGNGTQDIFYDDDSVFYFSTHEEMSFPGTGSMKDIGVEDGLGFNYNHRLASGSEDEDILKVYKEKLPPLVEEFNPDIILVSAGYDIHERDPLAGLNITTEGIRRLVSEILTLKDTPYIFMLEGGYKTRALAQSVRVTVEEMMK
ncbi:MAG: histone deacetylase [Sulfurimonas sp.]|nr:histone deacetylase [Sulfurimonas sp.]